MPKSHHTCYLAKLPADWETVRIDQLGEVYAGGTPGRDQVIFWNGSIAWVTPGELTSLPGKWLNQTRESITETGLASSGAHLLPKGSLLVTTRATIGEVAIATMPVCTNQGFKSIVPNPRSVPEFYYYLLKRIKPELVRLSSGSTFDEISRRDFVAIRLPRPSPGEQRRIANILDAIDAAIQQTEAVLAKLRLMKAGLLQDLLTRGLDEHGKLRDPEDNPEHFKKSKLGLIPKDWDIKQLKQLVVAHQAGIYKPALAYGSGTNIAGVSDLFQHDEITGQMFRLVQLSKQEQKQFRLKVGDIIYAESSLVFDGIAKTLSVGEGGAGTAFAWHTRRIRPDTNQVLPKYLSFALGSEPSRAFVRTRATQTALTGIPVAGYFETPLLLPKISEQYKIINVLNDHEAHITAEEAYRDKLRLQKMGLMQDLLTGRVRVTETIGGAA